MRRRWVAIAAIAIALAIVLAIVLWPRLRASSRLVAAGSADVGRDRLAPGSHRPPPGAPSGAGASPAGTAVPEFPVDNTPQPRGNDPSWHPPEHSEAEEDAAMARAEWLLDSGDAVLARDAAYQILARHPDDSRMLRVVVLAGCRIGGEGVKEARQYYPHIARDDRELVAADCRSHGVNL